MKHPMQRVETATGDRPRFVANGIVKRLLDDGGLDMNDIGLWDTDRQDLEQFYQLIGYSLDGFDEKAKRRKLKKLARKRRKAGR